jgi:hypothetical protein
VIMLMETVIKILLLNSQWIIVFFHTNILNFLLKLGLAFANPFLIIYL